MDPTCVTVMHNVQILMVHTTVYVVSAIVEMGTTALVGAFTVMIDNNLNNLIHLHVIIENQ